eukprot:4410378-Pyramimonas_sp.AAC.1
MGSKFNLGRTSLCWTPQQPSKVATVCGGGGGGGVRCYPGFGRQKWISQVLKLASSPGMTRRATQIAKQRKLR